MTAETVISLAALPPILAVTPEGVQALVAGVRVVRAFARFSAMTSMRSRSAVRPDAQMRMPVKKPSTPSIVAPSGCR